MFVQVIFLIISAICFGILRWRSRRLLKLYKQYKPRNIAFPIIGHTYLFLGSNEDRMSRLKSIGEAAYEKGGMIAHWHGSKLFFVVSDPIIAKTIMKNCPEKDDLIYNLFKSLIGNGSIFAPVFYWRSRRKAVAPTFAQKFLNQLVPIFDGQSHILANQLKEVVGKTVSIWKYFSGYSMDSVCESTLGVRVGAQQDSTKPFIQAFGEILRTAAERICKPWLMIDVLHQVTDKQYYRNTKYINDFVYQIVQSRYFTMEKDKVSLVSKTPYSNHEEMKPIVERLLESSRLELLELREEILVLILAGTDTSAVGISFTACMLAKHPKVQEACFEELQEVFGNSDRPVLAKDLLCLKYLEMVIKETLRLYPPVPYILRKVDKDVTLPSGTTLVDGCGAMISIYGIHRNPAYWGPDADQFRPERFLESDVDPDAFMPFSFGSRSCLGYQYAMMSMKTALATVLRRYRVLPPLRTGTAGQATAKPMRIEFDIMMKDVDNFQIQLESR